MLKPMEQHTEEARQDEHEFHLQVRIAVWASLFANFILCVLQRTYFHLSLLLLLILSHTSICRHILCLPIPHRHGD